MKLTYFFIFLLVFNFTFEILAGEGEKKLPQCGSMYTGPFGNSSDASPRDCPEPRAREYTPRYSGIGYDILDIESDACFVPDEYYKFLDQIVDDIISTLNFPFQKKSSKINRDFAVYVSKTIGDYLANNGFGLYIPTQTLGDALTFRNEPNEPDRHVMDCDTSSFIYLTVLENLGLPVSLIDITLGSGSGHNYIRWQLSDGSNVDWDTNGRGLCQTPKGLPPFEGKSMSHQQVKGYVYGVRAQLRSRLQDYKKAIEDYRISSSLYSESGTSSNNLAWMVATKEFSGRELLFNEALAEAKRAVNIERSANYLDTLACVFAVRGDFESAVKTMEEAIELGGTPDFDHRLKLLKAGKDCTGSK